MVPDVEKQRIERLLDHAGVPIVETPRMRDTKERIPVDAEKLCRLQLKLSEGRSVGRSRST